ncbi:Sec1-like protein, partial [Caulochytrium protostelioides]
KHVPLNADDRLYGQLRDMNFTAVAHVLNQIAKRIQENYDKRHAAKTVSELKAFVGTLGGLQAQSQSLTVHTHLAEQVMRRTTSVAFQRALEQQQHLLSGIHIDDVMLFVHELIGRQAPLDQVLRFLCLVSLVDHSIRPKAYEQLHHRIVLAYGYQHIVTLRALWRVGLFR